MKRDWTILVDSREKLPLPFPQHLTVLDPGQAPNLKRTVTIRLRIASRELETGDYLLSSHPSRTIIERKGSLREVAKNCLTGDRGRFTAALDRLAEESSAPVLLLEADLAQLGKRADLQLSLGVDRLLREVHQRGVHLLVLPGKTATQRRLVGEWVARLLINGALT